ncbi:DUF1801 domain-containing protein [Engelhardtia mirabilis]
MVTHDTPANTTAAVDAFMAQLEHPHSEAIELLRELILGVDDSIAEGIKWKSPSFRTTEYFATTNLRVKGGVGLILHLGAKVRDLPAGGIAIEDPEGLLDWLAKDRARVDFGGVDEVRERRGALEALLRQWIALV